MSGVTCKRRWNSHGLVSCEQSLRRAKTWAQPVGRRRARPKHALLLFVAAILLLMSSQGFAQGITLRVGHFPNITHVQALVAHNLSRQGKGWFERRLGPDVKIEWFVYNAGPSAMEAIFAKSVDLT